MIKAKKGLLITLFAALMIFAFGATSAFAAQEASYNADYSQVTISGSADTTQDGTYPTVRHFNGGAIEVQLDDTGIGGIDPATITTSQTSYYDFSKAEFASGAGAPMAATYTKYSAWVAPAGFIFSAPSYVDNPTAAAVYVPMTSLNSTTQDWIGAIVLKQDGETVTAVADKGTEDTTVEASLDVTYNSAATTKFNFIGSVSAKTATIKGAAKGTVPASLDGNIYVDELKTAEASADISKAYDGKEHTIMVAPVKGYTIKFTVFNTKTNTWDAVDAVTYKDAAAKVSARATYYDDSVANDPGTVRAFSITVTPSLKTPTINFTDEFFPYGPDLVKGQYDAWDYVVLSGTEVADDEAALMEYFKAAYEIKEEATSKFDTTAYKWTLSAITPAPKATDYAVLANYGAPGLGLIDTLNVTIRDSFDYEIEFVDTPSAVTYKAKKLKKNAASFTVTAICNDGTPVAYKLKNAPQKITIDKTTGEITLAKGLKKGKYNVTVKAYIPGQSTVLFETQDILIKVKK